MRWPKTPIERIPPDQFRPPRCPWAACPSHRHPQRRPFAARRHGCYRRSCDGRRVPRFRCRVCQRTFSQQTFACSYYLKRPELLIRIAQGLVGGQAHRQLARSEGCAASTVTRQAARLGRHAILLQAHCIEQLPDIDEAVGYDHFETFGISQYFPLGVGTAVGQNSRFVYSLDAAEHRRSGRMSVHQKRRRAELEAVHGRPPRESYARATTQTVDLLLSKIPRHKRLTLVMDDHRQCARALKRHPQNSRIQTKVYPNPPRGPKGATRSPQALARDLAMATLDKAHQFIRHSASHHRRETLAFARRHTALLERLFLHVSWLNLAKLWLENDPHSGTRAMRVGLTDQAWDWSRILARRLQPHEVDLPAPWRALYLRQPRYPQTFERKPHDLLHAL